MRVNLDLSQNQDDDVISIRALTGRSKQHIYDEAFRLGLESVKLRTEDDLEQEAENG